MTRSPGLLRLTRGRIATPRSAALVVVVLTLLASFLIAAAPRALAVVLHNEVAYQVGRLTTVTRDLNGTARGISTRFGPGTDPSLTEGWPEGTDQVLGALADRLAGIRGDASASVRRVTDPASFYLYTEPMRVYPSPERDPSPRPWVNLIFDPELQQQFRLVAGQWPAIQDGSGPAQVVMTTDVADDLEWELGEARDRLSGPATYEDYVPEPATLLELVGLLEPVDPGSARWQHGLPTALHGVYEFDGNSPPQMFGGVYPHPASPMGIGAEAVLYAWYPLNPAAVVAEEPAELLAGLRELGSQALPLGGETGDGVEVRVRFASQAIGVLANSIRRGDATTMTLAVAAVGPVAVSLALILLAAQLVIRRRRGDLLLLSARGTSLARLRGLLLLEGLLLGVIPAAAATAAALYLVPGDAGSLPTALALAVGLIPAVALALSLHPGTLTPGRVDMDAPRRSRWRRLLALLVVLVAALAVGLLLYRGVGKGTVGVDPLVILAPLLATVAVGMIAVRLHPLWLAAVLRRAKRGTRLPSLVGAARSLRDPAAGTTAVLAMMVAVAIAVFSSIVLATVDRGALLNAERAVGGDYAVSGPAFLPDMVTQVAALEQVERVAGFGIAERGQFSTGNGRIASVTVLATDFAALAEIQQGFIEPFTPGAAKTGQQPMNALASSQVVAETGLGPANGPQREFILAGEIPLLAGSSYGDAFVVVDSDDYAAVAGRTPFSRELVMTLAPGADIGELERAIAEIIGKSPQAGTSFTGQTLAERTAELQASPAITALRTALLAALVLAVLLSVVAILLVAGVSRDARSRVIALLRTMGMNRHQGRSIVAWEFVPLGVSALVGGLALGAGLPLIVLRSIDLRPFTGGGDQAQLAVNPLLTAGLVGAVLVALVLVVIGGVLAARTTSLVTVLRTEEDR